MSDAAALARLELDRLLQEPGTPEISLPPGFADAVEGFARLLLDANTRLNLTRITRPADMARDHLLDALSAVPTIDRLAPATAVDLGSGGGVPGLVLALARPSVRWTLVDSVRKKTDALRAFVQALGLTNVEVLAERAEALGRDASHRERHDLVTARAVAPLPVLAEYAVPLARPGGAVLAWKGRMADDERRAGTAAAAALGARIEILPVGVATLGDRSLVLLRKESSTPMAYPRRPGEPTRRPLG